MSNVQRKKLYKIVKTSIVSVVYWSACIEKQNWTIIEVSHYSCKPFGNFLIIATGYLILVDWRRNRIHIEQGFFWEIVKNYVNWIGGYGTVPQLYWLNWQKEMLNPFHVNSQKSITCIMNNWIKSIPVKLRKCSVLKLWCKMQSSILIALHQQNWLISQI